MYPNDSLVLLGIPESVRMVYDDGSGAFVDCPVNKLLAETDASHYFGDFMFRVPGRIDEESIRAIVLEQFGIEQAVQFTD